MTTLAIALALTLLTGARGATTPPHDYARGIVGSWIYSSKVRPTRIIVFHPDGSWGVRKFDERPEDVRGRRWRVEGGSLILRYPSDQGFETHAYRIISFTPREFITETGGYRSTYTRIEQLH
jgi:hypothetical protein